jgi:hypothetical protein
MLIGQGLDLTITFEGEANDAFNKEYICAKQTCGAFYVFGIHIDFGRGFDQTTHKSQFDHSTGILKIQPTPQLGSAILLAMVGQTDAST